MHPSDYTGGVLHEGKPYLLLAFSAIPSLSGGNRVRMHVTGVIHGPTHGDLG